MPDVLTTGCCGRGTTSVCVIVDMDEAVEALMEGRIGGMTSDSKESVAVKMVRVTDTKENWKRREGRIGFRIIVYTNPKIKMCCRVT